MNIPKRLHQIWVGDLPIPYNVRAWMRTWQECHPDWEYHIWRLHPTDLDNQVMYDENTNTGHRADIYRYELIYRYGGVYVDCDIECHQNIEPLLEEMSKKERLVNGFAALVTNPEGSVWPENSLFGFEQKSPILRDIINELPEWYYSNPDKSVSERTGPGMFGHFVQKWGHMVAYPIPQMFMPYNWTQKGSSRRGLYGTHYWLGSWANQEGSYE